MTLSPAQVTQVIVEVIHELRRGLARGNGAKSVRGDFIATVAESNGLFEWSVQRRGNTDAPLASGSSEYFDAACASAAIRLVGILVQE